MRVNLLIAIVVVTCFVTMAIIATHIESRCSAIFSDAFCRLHQEQ